MEEAFLKLIRDDAGVQAQLSSRVHWLRRPQSESIYPTCILQRISGDRKYHMQAPDGISSSRVQIDVWGKSYSAAKLAARAIIAVLTGYKGTVLTTKFQGIFIEGERDLIDEENDANERLYRVSVDALIWHNE